MSVAKKAIKNSPKKNLPKKIEIYDSTLRDGSQAEKINFSIEDKMAIIQRLDDFGVNYIEAGNPLASPKDAAFFKYLFETRPNLKNAKILAFGFTKKPDVLPAQDESLRALLGAHTQRVALCGKSSDFHVTNVLNVTLDENISMISESVGFLVNKKRVVFYEAEHFFDGFKSNPEYTLKTIEVAITKGASAIILCDTNGNTFPTEIAAGVKAVRELVDKYLASLPEGSNKEISIGIHAHNDSGCADANSIIAVENGANQVQGTFLGFGERAGNANLSVIIPNLQLKLKINTVPDLKKLTDTAYEIAEISNFDIPKNTPFIGDSVFAHKAGMHADGVSKASASFEHISPEDVGNNRRFIVSEQSGKASVAIKISSFMEGVTKDSPLVEKITQKVKDMAKDGYVFETATASFELMVRRETGEYTPFFNLIDFKVMSYQKIEDYSIGFADNSPSGAMVKVRVGNKVEVSAGEGEGPVNAIEKALRKALEIFYPSLSETHLTDYSVRIVDGKASTEAITRVQIESSNMSDAELETSEKKGEKWVTIGVSKDIITASVIALVDAWEYNLYKSGEQNLNE